MAITTKQIDAFRNLDAFRAFAADTAGDDSVVHFSKADRSCLVDANDRIRSITTWTAPHRDVAANNATREAFRDSLLALFDKKNLADLPDSVKDVLKTGDFDGTGKPLSVRRIKAVMAAVVETDDYRETAAYAALAGFADAKLGVADGDTRAEVLQKTVDFCAKLTTSSTQGGGGLNKVLEEIGGNLKMQGMKSDATGLFVGIQRAFAFGEAFCFGTGKVVGQGQFDNLQKTEGIRVARTCDDVQDLDDFFAAWKSHAETRFRDANKDADVPTVEAALQTITKELQKLVDRIKVRMAALACLNRMPGATDAEKFRNFMTLAALIRTGDRNVTFGALADKACRLAPMLFFKVDRSRLAQAKAELAQFLRQALANAKAKGTQLNPVTGVNALALREMNNRPISVNGDLIPEVNPRVQEEVVTVPGIKGDELTPDVWQCANTGVTGATSGKSVGVHKALCKAIRDPRMRAFVSTMISTSLGIKNFFDSRVDKNGTDGDTLRLFGDGRVGTRPLSENQVIAVPLRDRNIMESYEIMTNGNGDVAVTARFAVGTQSVKEGGEVYSKSTFEVIINLKNAFDGQGIPDMEILGIDVEG